MCICRKHEVNCSKKKGIIVGSVIGTLFGSSALRMFVFYPVDPTVSVLLGALYLYGIWSDRRKKQRGSSTAEENRPLSDESGTVSDCEKGIAKASNNKNENYDDRIVRPPSTGSCKIPLTTFPYRFHRRHILTNQRKRRFPRRVRLRQISQLMVTTDLRVSPKPTHLSQHKTPVVHP